jgi:hypothetical protein
MPKKELKMSFPMGKAMVLGHLNFKNSPNVL